MFDSAKRKVLRGTHRTIIGTQASAVDVLQETETPPLADLPRTRNRGARVIPYLLLTRFGRCMTASNLLFFRILSSSGIT